MKKPRKTLLRRLFRELERRVDFREGWENSNSETNGEHILLSKVLPKARLIVDVGANIGDWTQACLQLNPEVKILAFEASPETAKTFEIRFYENENVTFFNFGLGEKDGFFEFYDHGTNAESSGFYSREGSVGRKHDRVIRAEMRRLDSIEELRGADSIDFVKIDTEGSEMGVMRGATEFLENHRIRLLQFEYGGAWIDARLFLVDAFELLSSYGYLIGRICPKEIWWIDNYHSDLEKFKYANFVACASEKHAKELAIL
jgi:FkbM family methyltransferase